MVNSESVQTVQSSSGSTLDLNRSRVSWLILFLSLEQSQFIRSTSNLSCHGNRFYLLVINLSSAVNSPDSPNHPSLKMFVLMKFSKWNCCHGDTLSFLSSIHPPVSRMVLSRVLILEGFYGLYYDVLFMYSKYFLQNSVYHTLSITSPKPEIRKTVIRKWK